MKNILVALSLLCSLGLVANRPEYSKKAPWIKFKADIFVKDSNLPKNEQMNENLSRILYRLYKKTDSQKGACAIVTGICDGAQIRNFFIKTQKNPNKVIIEFSHQEKYDRNLDALLLHVVNSCCYHGPFEKYIISVAPIQDLLNLNVHEDVKSCVKKRNRVINRGKLINLLRKKGFVKD